jgi:sulfate adenylyltransferase subunit 1
MAPTAELEQRRDFADFLERDLNKELLRFTTAGSVDDGKSTLIGRLLHDSKAVYEDQLASVKLSRINRSGRAIDFSLLTDGLRAEREQGITIDVAYRYFATARRKFIIADTPGHEQYTRNMATGASTADLAVILVDGTKGLLPQTRRHAYISALLGIPHVVAAVNKMDLANYSEERFLELKQDFEELASSLGIESVVTIPISALDGDNVVAHGGNMPWYEGATLMEHLETVEIPSPQRFEEFRFAVQSVIRPDATFRGFAGRIAGGIIRPGDPVLALPSRRRTKVKAIVSYDGELEVAIPQQSVVLRLEDEIDLSRGDLLVSPDTPPCVSDRFVATVVWLDAQPLRLDRSYLVKHSGRLLRAKASRIRFRVNVNDATEHPAVQLEMNEIALVEFVASSPLFFDRYEQNRATGSFIVIDPLSNATVGAAMIREELPGSVEAPFERSASARRATGRITKQERAERHRHVAGVLVVQGGANAAERLERELFLRGFEAFLFRKEEFPASARATLLAALSSAGILVIYAGELAAGEIGAVEVAFDRRIFPLHSAEPANADEIVERGLSIAETLRIGNNLAKGHTADHD